MVKNKIHISINHGSILDVDCAVIVNAANSHGTMGGGVAGVIKMVAGTEVEEEARKQAPIAVGQAVLTSGGQTAFQGIIHAPTMSQPARRIPASNVVLATKAALLLADDRGFISMALPGMGTGVGGVSFVEAAAHMIEVVQSFQPKHLQSVVLVDVDCAMIEAWSNCLMSSRHRSTSM